MIFICKIFVFTDLYDLNSNEISDYAKQFVKKKAAEFYKLADNEILLEYTKNGKPYIKNREGFCFNISHTKNALAIAFSSQPIGIDIEKLREPDLRVAKRFFNSNENEYILNGDCKKRFFEIWTKKEANIKKDGLTLSHLARANTKNTLTFSEDDYVISVCCEENIAPDNIVLEKSQHL